MRLLAFAIGMWLGTSPYAVVAEEARTLDSEIDRISYSLGYQIGRDFKRQGMALDRSAFLRGVEQALTNAEPLMSEDQRCAVLLELKRRIMDTEREARRNKLATRRAQAERKRKEGQAFLEANAKKPHVQTLPSGLQYKVIRAGTGKKPNGTDSVTVHYRGTRLTGNEFDSSLRDGKPVTFRIRDVIPGWREALQLMQEGAKWELYIPPELGYGRSGPLADETLIFEVELLEVEAEGKAIEGTPPSATPTEKKVSNAESKDANK